MNDPRFRKNCLVGALVKLRNGVTGKILHCKGELDYHPLGMMVELEDGTRDRVSELLETNLDDKKSTFPKESMKIEYKASYSIPIESNDEIMKRYKIPDERALKLRLPEISETLRFSVLKTIAAFANTYGGTLCIGIIDRTHEILGLEKDYDAINSDGDGLITDIKSKIKSAFQSDYYEIITNCLMKIICDSSGLEYLKIDVTPSVNPVSIKVNATVKNQKIIHEKFYVRTNNGSEEYPASYFFMVHWPNREKKTEMQLT